MKQQNSTNKTSHGRKNRFARIRCFFLFTILVLLLGVYIIPGGKLKVRKILYSFLPSGAEIISLSGTPYEVGVKHGKSRSLSIKLLCRLYLKNIVCEGNQKIFSARRRDAERLFEKISKRWRDEIKGISDGSGVPADVIAFGNAFMDMGTYRSACRQIVINATIGKTGEKYFLHAHNLDWDNLGGVGNFLVTVFKIRGTSERLGVVYFAFPGMAGALTVVNEKGVSLGFNQLGFSDGNPCGLPLFIKLRDIAETCATFNEAKERILNLPGGMPFCIVVADAKNNKSAVFERVDKTVNIRYPVDHILVADNNPWCSSDITRCSVFTVAKKAFSRNRSKGKNAFLESPVQVLQKVLRNSKVLLSCNIYSVIIDFHHNRFFIAAGEIPAAQGVYKEYTLFDTENVF